MEHLGGNDLRKIPCGSWAQPQQQLEAVQQRVRCHLHSIITITGMLIPPAIPSQMPRRFKQECLMNSKRAPLSQKSP